MQAVAIAVFAVVAIILLVLVRHIADIYVRMPQWPLLSFWFAGILLSAALSKLHRKFAESMGLIMFGLLVLHLILHISAG